MGKKSLECNTLIMNLAYRTMALVYVVIVEAASALWPNKEAVKPSSCEAVGSLVQMLGFGRDIDPAPVLPANSCAKAYQPLCC